MLPAVALRRWVFLVADVPGALLSAAALLALGQISDSRTALLAMLATMLGSIGLALGATAVYQLGWVPLRHAACALPRTCTCPMALTTAHSTTHVTALSRICMPMVVHGPTEMRSRCLTLTRAQMGPQWPRLAAHAWSWAVCMLLGDGRPLL